MKLAAILVLALSAHASYSHTKAPSSRPRIVCDRWQLIDGGKRWKQTAWYSDGSRKCFVIEIPSIK